ncbi:hypothetical protein SLS56_005501 [Neofusicoccum ribis]|uniref:Uncharacterized protein n=1 Tax=Neofusicoccum ribis TaxID=45134 RepID=A0ABR3SU79_9PEZI
MPCLNLKGSYDFGPGWRTRWWTSVSVKLKQMTGRPYGWQSCKSTVEAQCNAYEEKLLAYEENPSGSEPPNEGDWGNLMELWYGVRSSKKQEEQEAQELATASREATRVSDQQRSNMLARMANKRSVDSALSPERDEDYYSTEDILDKKETAWSFLR